MPKITDLPALTVISDDDILPIVDAPGTTPGTKQVSAATLKAYIGHFVPLAMPLISTSWDGDSFSTTGKTKINLNAVFGAPAGIKAALVYVAARDSASQTVDTYLILSPVNTDLAGLATQPPYTNDRYQRTSLVVPCDSDGNIYYQIGASGAGTFDVVLQIWGYWVEEA